MSFCFGDGCHCAYFRLCTFVRLPWQAQPFWRTDFISGVVLLLLYTYGGCRLQLLMLRCYRKKGHLLCGLSHEFCSTIASFLIRSWVGAHAFFAARTKFYGHTQKYIPLPLWLFPGLRVWSSLVCSEFLLLCLCVYFAALIFFAHVNSRRTPTLCVPRAYVREEQMRCRRCLNVPIRIVETMHVCCCDWTPAFLLGVPWAVAQFLLLCFCVFLLLL